MNGYEGSPNGARVYRPAFVPLEGAKSLTVTVLVNRPLLFDFMVNPADARSGK